MKRLRALVGSSLALRWNAAGSRVRSSLGALFSVGTRFSRLSWRSVGVSRWAHPAHVGRVCSPCQGQANPKESIVALKFRATVAAAVIALALCAGTAALASGSSLVVPPGGKVAGHSYSQWEAIGWQAVLSRMNGGPPCVTAHTPSAVFKFSPNISLTANRRRGLNRPRREHLNACGSPSGPPLHPTTDEPRWRLESRSRSCEASRLATDGLRQPLHPAWARRRRPPRRHVAGTAPMRAVGHRAARPALTVGAG